MSKASWNGGLLAVWASVAVAGVVGLSACGILDVQTQSQITEDALQLPQNADLIVNGAVSDFECALGAYTVGMGLLSDEFESAGGAALFFDWDRRTRNRQAVSLARCYDVPIGRIAAFTPEGWQRLAGG